MVERPPFSLFDRTILFSAHTAFTSGLRYIARFLFIVVVGKFLPAKEFGQYSVIVTTVGLLSYFLQGESHLYYIFRIPGKSARQQMFLYKSIVFGKMTLVALVFGLFCLLPGAREHFSAWFNIPLTGRLFFLLILLVFAEIMILDLQRFLSATQNIVRCNTVLLCQHAFWVFLLIIWRFCSSTELTKVSLLAFWLLGDSLGIVIGWRAISLVRFFKSAWRCSVFKKAYIYGVAAFVSGIASFCIDFFDRYYLSFLRKFQALGVYAFQYNLVLTIHAAVGPLFVNAVLPMLIQAYNHNQIPRAQKYFQYIIKFTLMTLLPVCVLYFLCHRDLLRIVAKPDYFPERTLVLLLICVPFFSFLNGLLSHMTLFLERGWSLVVVNICAAVVNIGLNFIFIPRWGASGAAATTLVAMAVHSLGLHLILKGWPFRVMWARVVSAPAVLVAIGTIIVGRFGVEHFLPENAFLRILIFGVWVGVIFGIFYSLGPVFDVEEKRLIRRLLEKIHLTKTVGVNP